MESLYNIINIVGKIVRIDNMVEAFRSDVERRPSSILRYYANED